MKKITSITRGYYTSSDRKRAISMLKKMGFNYFVCYKDVQSDFALNIGIAEWVKKGEIYIDW